MENPFKELHSSYEEGNGAGAGRQSGDKKGSDLILLKTSFNLNFITCKKMKRNNSSMLLSPTTFVTIRGNKWV